MKPVTKKARVETAYGNKLDTPIEFTYSYQELQDKDEVPANEHPDADGLRSYANAKRNAKARAKAQAAAFEENGIKAPTLEDADTRLKQMTKIFVANGDDEDVAEQKARAALGM